MQVSMPTAYAHTVLWGNREAGPVTGKNYTRKTSYSLGKYGFHDSLISTGRFFESIEAQTLIHHMSVSLRSRAKADRGNPSHPDAVGGVRAEAIRGVLWVESRCTQSY